MIPRTSNEGWGETAGPPTRRKDSHTAYPEGHLVTTVESGTYYILDSAAAAWSGQRAYMLICPMTTVALFAKLEATEDGSWQTFQAQGRTSTSLEPIFSN